jgi:putative phosphonate metabolism protein
MTSARYAIYWSPHPDTALGAFGRAWLGRDAETGTTTSPPVGGDLVEQSWRAAIADAALYGFHATLKPPFRLAAGHDVAALDAAIQALAATECRPFELKLHLADLDGFLALVPEGEHAAANRLAALCVEKLDRFRAPADAAELARRRAAGLTPHEEELLQRWGYPWVMDAFRFHMTLTRRLAPQSRALFRKVLEPLVAEVCARPVEISALCLFEQPHPGAPFVVRRRHPFAASPAVHGSI